MFLVYFFLNPIGPHHSASDLKLKIPEYLKHMSDGKKIDGSKFKTADKTFSRFEKLLEGVRTVNKYTGGLKKLRNL